MDNNIFSYSNNANGFMSAEVNERNGCFNFSLHIADIKANNLNGPELSLTLSFDQNSKDDVGFGPALRLSLPYVDVVNHLFVNDKGITVKLDSTNNHPIEPCLLDFKFDRTGDNTFRVLYIDGTTDFYEKKSAQSNRALLIRRENSAANTLKLEWGVTDKLKKIYDDIGSEFLSIRLEGDKYKREITLYGGRRFIYTYNNQDTHTISLPYSSTGQWQSVEKYTVERTLDTIARSYYVINSITQPDGSRHELSYTRLILPSAAQYPSLPAVQKHVLTKDSIVVASSEYVYNSSEDDGDNNAYGLNAVLSIESYSDPLYSLKKPYFYTVEKKEYDHHHNERIKIYRYDKFHNIIQSRTIYKGCSEIDTMNYQTNDISDVANQPRTFKLVKTHSKKYISSTGEFEELYDYKYDDYGNLLEEIDNIKGVKVVYQYYDTLQNAEADLCPKYDFICFIKSQMIIDLISNESRIVSSRKYKCIGSKWPLLILIAEDQNIYSDVHTIYTYDSIGRQKTITLKKGESYRMDELVYLYTNGNLCVEVISSTNDQYNDTLHEFHVYDLLTEQLIEVNEQGSTIAYDYYPDGRLMTETVAKGTEYSCEKKYVYHDKDNSISIIDHAQNEKLIKFSPLGKVIKTYLTIPGVVNEFLSEAFDYNTLGQCYRSTSYDSTVGGRNMQAWESINNYEYSGWGSVERTLKPDGQINIEHYDPVSQVKIKGIEGLPYEERIIDWNSRKITHNNRSSDGTLMSSLSVCHNAFSEMISSVNDKGVYIDYEHDQLGRPTNIKTLFTNDGSQFSIERNIRYSKYDLTGEYKEAITINDIEIGSRDYDGHGRLRTELIGNQKTSFEYTPGSIFYSRIVKNDRDVIDASYNPHLGVYTMLGNNIKTYDSRTGAVLLAERSDLNGALSFKYRFDGRLICETSVHGDNIHEYTLKGLPIYSQYCDGTSKLISYDALQRPTKVADGINLITYEAYDRFSRPLSIRSVGENNFLMRYDYSNLPFSESIATECDGHELIEKYNYTSDGKINIKETSLNGDILNESFSYDPIGRLVTYSVNGSRAPKDPYGNTISAQTFAYDCYGNICKAIVTMADGKIYSQTFTYAEDNPVKLVMIENSNSEYGCHDFYECYDNNNNLLTDESGNSYSYNVYGELKEVRDRSGLLLCAYDYDALGRVIYQRLGDQPIIEYKFNGESLLSLAQADARTYFSYLGDKPIGKRHEKNKHIASFYYITDKGNSPLRVINNDIGTSHGDYVYTPYGNRSALSN